MPSVSMCKIKSINFEISEESSFKLELLQRKDGSIKTPPQHISGVIIKNISAENYQTLLKLKRSGNSFFEIAYTSLEDGHFIDAIHYK